MPDNTLKQPVPTPTAEELASKILDIGDSAIIDFTKKRTLRDALKVAEETQLIALKKASSLINSALTQAREEARREAADDMCNACPAQYDPENCKGCHKRAAILGHGEGKP